MSGCRILNAEVTNMGGYQNDVITITCGHCGAPLMQYQNKYLLWYNECEHFRVEPLGWPRDTDETEYKIVKAIWLRDGIYAILKREEGEGYEQ